MHKIFIHESPGRGRGVFAAGNIDKGEVIEIAPIIVLEFEELVDTKWNTMFDYYFWMDDYVVLALGYGSIYNHTEDANAKYEIDREKMIITYIATRDIKKGNEIFFNYRGDPSSKDDKGSTTHKAPLWFERGKK